jgi:hypothetical protein
VTPRSLRSVVLHGHFYQPPRDDPWLETVRREPSAAPAHDWNERIDRECYRAVTAARTQDARGRILSITNTLEWISFNVGPTLLEWMERHAPTTYRDVLEADARARVRTGWGTALAQPYHHAILPLASPRDRKTEIRWGIADFRRRFGRDPLGMWLPETAVDLDTLDDLAAEGIAFTIVGDHQVESAPAGGRPGWVTTPGGRRIAVFCYDGPLSHGVAFGNLLRDAGAWTRAILKGVGLEDAAQGATLTHGPTPTYAGAGAPAPHPHQEVVLLATDGETFGHHHPFGDMALAALLERLRKHPTVRVEPLAAVLERFPPREELELRSPSAWSCAHGVERWRSDCGCRTATGTHQGWRAPLRNGLDALAEGLHQVYETETRVLGVDNPWELRDALGSVVGAGPGRGGNGSTNSSLRKLSSEGRMRIRVLLEMERDVLRSFTSCGWFFDDIGGSRRSRSCGTPPGPWSSRARTIGRRSRRNSWAIWRTRCRTTPSWGREPTSTAGTCCPIPLRRCGWRAEPRPWRPSSPTAPSPPGSARGTPRWTPAPTATKDAGASG